MKAQYELMVPDPLRCEIDLDVLNTGEQFVERQPQTQY